MVPMGDSLRLMPDMASRTLSVGLDVDRPDPENRVFTHDNPIKWTLDNRGRILRALYIILLSNPQLQPDRRKTEKTRFKPWWHLVGSAVENAASSLVEHQQTNPSERPTATAVDFGALFASVESDDEETIGLADTLEILHATWPNGYFQASHVANLINQPMEADDDKANLLRGFFDPTGRRQSGTVSCIAIGRHLGRIVDAPVRVGDRILKLARSNPDIRLQQRRTAWFQVKMI
jgi:hypothetical protein